MNGIQILRTRSVSGDATWAVAVVEAGKLLQKRGPKEYRAIGYLEPVAIVISGQGNAYAYDTSAEPLDLDELRQTVPELDALIEKAAG